MTEAEAQVRRALGRVELAYPETKPGAPWDARRRDVWVAALAGCEPEHVEAGVDRLIASWTALRPPAPGNLREHVDAVRASRDGGQRGPQRPATTVNRCPVCAEQRHGGGIIFDPATGLASCDAIPAHGFAWRAA